MSVQIHRCETKTSGGVQIKGNSGFVPGQLLYGSLVPYRASIVTLPLHRDCPTKHGEDSLRARRPPWSHFRTSARRERCALYPGNRRANARRLKAPEADSAKRTVVRWIRLPGAISRRRALQRPRLRWRFQPAGNPAGRDRIHRVLGDRVCEAMAAVPALKRAELKTLRAGRDPQQHHAALAFRTSGPADRKQARLGARM
jgi:hypothetical protein